MIINQTGAVIKKNEIIDSPGKLSSTKVYKKDLTSSHTSSQASGNVWVTKYKLEETPKVAVLKIYWEYYESTAATTKRYSSCEALMNFAEHYTMYCTYTGSNSQDARTRSLSEYAVTPVYEGDGLYTSNLIDIEVSGTELTITFKHSYYQSISILNIDIAYVV